MKTLYIDCGMGAAGDMLTAALLDLFPEPDKVAEELKSLQIPGVEFDLTRTQKCGITGSHMRVRVNGEEETSEDVHEHDHHHEHHHDHGHTHDHGHHHGHRGMQEIRDIIAALPVSEKVRSDVEAVYALIAEAESHAHGRPVSEIHFHEVGTMDAIADITAVCYLMEKLGAEKVIASPVHVGSGQVRCAHGILPVPAPATAHILQGIPMYGGQIRGELCTPTGAALLKHFVGSFGEMPAMRTESIGYGMGNKDFEAANCIRVLLGETEEKQDMIVELACNLDDMTAEEIAYAAEKLMAAGALDVYTLPIGMKKGRPGILLNVACRENKKEELLKCIFTHTSTIGIREYVSRRHVLKRTEEIKETQYGPVKVKHSIGYGVDRSKYEYEDLARIASEQEISIAEVKARL